MTPAKAIPPALLDKVRAHKAELLPLLRNPGPQTEPAASAEELAATFDLETVADAIAVCPRSPFLNDLAIASAARAAIESRRVIRALTADGRREAEAIARRDWERAAAAIRASNYERAYALLDGLSVRLRPLN